MNKVKKMIKKEHGFTLFEFLIGIVISLMAIYFTSIAFLNTENVRQNNDSTSGNLAASTSAIQLISNDIKNAGYGINALSLIGGTVNYSFSGTGYTTPDSGSFVFTPIDISNGNESDSIAILYSTSSMVGTQIKLSNPASGDDSSFTVDNVSPFLYNHGKPETQLVIIAEKNKPYRLFRVNSITSNAGDTNIKTYAELDSSCRNSVCPDGMLVGSVDVADTTPADGNNFNDAASLSWTTPSYSNSATYLFNMGNMSWKRFKISNGQLFFDSINIGGVGTGSNAVEVGGNVVALQAIYALDTNSDYIPDSYDSGAAAVNYPGIVGVKYAIVVRNDKADPQFTATVPTWSGEDLVSAGQVNDVKFDAAIQAIPDWTHYRYKVYESFIPLRNIYWNPNF